jgi:hypothetical protein
VPVIVDALAAIDEVGHVEYHGIAATARPLAARAWWCVCSPVLRSRSGVPGAVRAALTAPTRAITTTLLSG